MVPDWLTAGRGRGPELEWSYVSDGLLTALSVAREAGETFAADDSGRLDRINRTGRRIDRLKLSDPVRLMDWSDDGRIGAIVCDENQLHVFDGSLNRLWHRAIDAPVRCLATAPFGSHFFIARDDGLNQILDLGGQEVARFETQRSLSFARFVSSSPEIIAAADHGLLCRYRLNGEPVWNETLWSAVGQLAITGDGSRVQLACYAHGIQTFDGVNGEALGSYVVDGTVSRTATTYEPRRVAAATIERMLYWINRDGEILWSVAVPDDVLNLACAPLTDGLTVGFTHGRLFRLRWS